LEVPLLLLLEVPPLPLRLPSNLALLRRDALTLTLDGARQPALLSAGRAREERHQDDGQEPSHALIVALILARSRRRTEWTRDGQRPRNAAAVPPSTRARAPG